MPTEEVLRRGCASQTISIVTEMLNNLFAQEVDYQLHIRPVTTGVESNL